MIPGAADNVIAGRGPAVPGSTRRAEPIMLSTIPPPGPWAKLGLCLGSNPEAWFPARGESTRPAKDVCSRCPVVAPCLQYALDNVALRGVFGGTSERERRKVRKARTDRRVA